MSIQISDKYCIVYGHGYGRLGKKTPLLWYSCHILCFCGSFVFTTKKVVTFFFSEPSIHFFKFFFFSFLVVNSFQVLSKKLHHTFYIYADFSKAFLCMLIICMCYFCFFEHIHALIHCKNRLVHNWQVVVCQFCFTENTKKKISFYDFLINYYINEKKPSSECTFIISNTKTKQLYHSYAMRIIMRFVI